MNRPADDIDALAGEYVIGTLSSAARLDVEARMRNEPALRQAVHAWETRLLPLTALAPPAEPTPALWGRIEKSVAADSVTAASPAKLRRAAGSWWSSLGLWRGLAGAGFAIAGILASVLVLRIGVPVQPQYMVVLVAPQDRAPGWVVQTSASRELSLVPLGTMTLPENKSLQFWTKGEQWRAPVSLGLVTPGRTLRIGLDSLPPLEPNQLFELTLEPVNGSPLDRPTGPVLYIGRAVKVL